MPGLPQLLRSIATLYRTRRDDVERQAEELRQFYQAVSAAKIELPDRGRSGLDAGAGRACRGGDSAAWRDGRGGGRIRPRAQVPARRWPSNSCCGSRRGFTSDSADNDETAPVVQLTLDKMADGGIYDQLGGGFHRYATDAHWLVPHFEKMLYDNALLASRLPPRLAGHRR